MKHLFSFALCLLIAGGGAAFLFMLSVMKSEEVDSTAISPAAPATNVRIEVLEPAPIDDVLLLTGRIDPWEEVLLSAEVSGVIERNTVQEGDTVRKGQELIKINQIWYDAAHTQALAQHELANQELDRIKNLRQSGVSSPQDLDRTITQQKLAAADLAFSRTQLEKSSVFAPINGVVDTLELKEGEWAERGKPLMKLVQVDRVKAIIGIPDRDIPRFALGDEVNITLDALPDQKFTGVVYRIATSADTMTRTFNTEIELDNAEGLLKPGMTLRARLIRDSFPDAITVPIFSVLSVQNQRFVAVESNAITEIRPIEVGILQGNRVQVTNGLAPGEHLIVVGHRDLRPGEPVRVMSQGAP
jgi:membrane fusion protein, multidrug efflux system